MERQKFFGLEWYRFGLAMYLLVYHTLPFYPAYADMPLIRPFVELGFFSTTAFFALSGFLLTHVYLANDRMREPSRSFLYKRFANLYPIHIFTMVFAISLVAVTSLVDSNTSLATAYRVNDLLERFDPERLEYPMSTVEVWINGFLNITLLQAWNPLFVTYNGPAWSISALMFFYLTFPVLGPMLVKAKYKWLVLLGLIMLAAAPALYVIATSSYFKDIPMGLLHRMPPLQLPTFLAGVVAYSLFKQYRQNGVVFGPGLKVGLIVLIALAIAASAYLNLYGGIFWFPLLRNGALLPVALMLLIVCSGQWRPKSPFWLRLGERLGAASLSIFALHLPLFILFRRFEMLTAIDFQLCLTDASACVAAAKDYEIKLIYYPVLVGLTVWLSVLFQERIVTPTKNWLLSRRGQKPVAIAAQHSSPRDGRCTHP
ncbi:acyltransferase [Pseudomonas stutzeri]|uniref:acyltransferase family protein n=1 Tax=Stutzerimonas stutzeri TaxID=316 RepID=UPI00210933FC|nr:acyltransferase [Stutzerimonas stutzeri]MCQ4312121.1 acyltransferase [Stutzerimonas stutzeri]